MGREVGRLVGWYVGFLVGLYEGPKLGLTEGFPVVGLAVGLPCFTEGDAVVGFGLGFKLGLPVGFIEGFCVVCPTTTATSARRSIIWSCIFDSKCDDLARLRPTLVLLLT